MDYNNLDAEEQKNSADNSELVEEQAEAEESFAEDTYEVDVPKKKARKVNKQFFIGMVIGWAAGLIILMLVIVIAVKASGVRLVPKGSVQGGTTGNNTSETVLDDYTIEKINAILTVFDKASILELDTEKFRRALIDGVVAGSGDKYAQYYDAEEITELMGDYGGTFFGIGASLSLNSMGYAEVQSVYTNSPAQSGGVREGDIITQVDGVDVYGMTLDEIVAKIRGAEGTQVVVTVAREGEKDYLDLTLTRAKIEVVVVEYEMKEDNIGFIHIEQWYDTTPDQFAEAMEDLRSQGMEKLIVDLRSNTGGLLRSVVSVCEQLLPAGTIVYTENKDGVNQTYSCDGSHEIDIPVVILTNGYTASASEIFTGAMKDHGKAISLGTNTYGKGVVQSFFDFTDGTAMKLTTEQYFTPNGTAIDGIGIAPDIEVEFDSDAYYNETNRVDNQLEAAIDYLKNK